MKHACSRAATILILTASAPSALCRTRRSKTLSRSTYAPNVNRTGCLCVAGSLSLSLHSLHSCRMPCRPMLPGIARIVQNNCVLCLRGESEDSSACQPSCRSSVWGLEAWEALLGLHLRVLV
jgi:hypothetical protein